MYSVIIYDVLTVLYAVSEVSLTNPFTSTSVISQLLSCFLCCTFICLTFSASVLSGRLICELYFKLFLKMKLVIVCNGRLTSTINKLGRIWAETLFLSVV